MASTNPAFNDSIFQRESQAATQGAFTPGWGAPSTGAPAATAPPGYPVVDDTASMRLSGTISATAVLLGVLVVAGWFGWQNVGMTFVREADGSMSVLGSPPAWLPICMIAGFGIAILTIFKPKIARITAPLYAVAEGLLLGAISAIFEGQYPGIAFQAAALTVGVLAVMLVLYATRTIRVTNKLRSGIMVAMGAILVVYLVSIIANLFGAQVPLIYDSGPIGIGFSLLVCGVAAFRLLLDFDFIERGVAMRAPRYMEWFAAFGLLLTLVWLYMEILRLLSKLRSR